MKLNKTNRDILTGAVFLMGLSSIGPGFLTQTTVFTQQFRENFAFIILVSILMDVGAQVNIWRIITVSNLRGQEIANKLIPGLGFFIATVVMLGGIAFNVGNVAGAGLGLQVITGLPVKAGAIISAAIAIGIFLFKSAGRIMDKFVQFAGILMILLISYIVFKSSPPVVDAAKHAVAPDTINSGIILAIITLVGGTVGGYISFSGAHRLLDAKVSGIGFVKNVSRASIMGVGVTAIVRVILFLAVLGVVSAGVLLEADNPLASVFESAAGKTGYIIFGIILWAASITSVIGASYTSVTFLSLFKSKFTQNHNRLIILMILISTIIFVGVGNPVKTLVFVGTLNGLVLPLTLGPILMAAHKKQIVGEYRHPRILTFFGAVVMVVMLGMSFYSIYHYIAGL